MSRMTFIDNDSSIDHLYFLHWIQSAGTQNLFGMLEQIDSNIFVYSIRGICWDGNWRLLEGCEQTTVTLSMIRYTTTVHMPLEDDDVSEEDSIDSGKSEDNDGDWGKWYKH